MKHYYILLEELRKRIINDEKTSKLGIGNTKDWKQREYELLAQAIGRAIEVSPLPDSQKKELGFTISVTTLERIFKHGYNFGNSIDKRQEKTLSKLCIYLGYSSFAEYQTQFNNVKQSENEILQLLIDANQAEFNAYKLLPKINSKELALYFHEESPAFKRILHILQLNVKRNWIISEPSNPSYQRVLSLEVVSKTENKIEIRTRENWYLRWFDVNNENYPFIYDELNHQFYQLLKKNGAWKIELNHYETTNTNFAV